MKRPPPRKAAPPQQGRMREEATRRRGRHWRSEPVQLRDVAKRHLGFLILRDTREDARDDCLGMGPDRVVMRRVVAPDEVVHADKMARQHADGVVFKGGIKLALK